MSKKIFLIFLSFFCLTFFSLSHNPVSSEEPPLSPCSEVMGPLFLTNVIDGPEDGLYSPGDTFSFNFEGYIDPEILDEGEINLTFFIVTGPPWAHVGWSQNVLNNLQEQNGLFGRELIEDVDYTIGNTFPDSGDTYNAYIEHLGAEHTGAYEGWKWVTSETITGTIQDNVIPGGLALGIFGSEQRAVGHTFSFQYYLHEKLVADGEEGGWRYVPYPAPPYTFDPENIDTEVWSCTPLAITEVVPALVMPTSFGDITHNLGDIGNLTMTEQELTFAVEAGSITFAPGLNIMHNNEQLLNIQHNLGITYDKENNQLRAKVDTQAMQFLAQHSATIRFFDFAEQLGLKGVLTKDNLQEYLDIDIFQGDTQVTTNLSDFFDWKEVTYDAGTDVLTLPVNHFTEYVLGEKVEEEEEVVVVEEEDEDVEEEVVEEDEEEKLPETGSAIIVGTTLATLTLLGYCILKKTKKLNI